MTEDTLAQARDVGRYTAKGRATRTRIVEAAAGLMFESGVSGTSIEDVLGKASASASQLYHYFDDKHALVRAVIAFQTDATLDLQRPLLDRLDSVAALQEWCDLHIAIQISRNLRGGCPIGSLASELADADPESRADLADGFARWGAPIRAGLSTMQARGELQSDVSPAALATALMAALQGGLLLAQTQRDIAPLRDALTVMMDYIRSLQVTDP
ncbi:MAG: putative TetR-family transcriptional regulator [Glaciihabitans sp.]|jgi:TetR/AcrR family transcriptional repressor of nem operon|nr:putative TetR-family transcriptional regulator [Glaciihabitans sp.]